MKKLILFLIFVFVPLIVESSELEPLIDDIDYLENVVLPKDMPYGAEYTDTSLYMIGDVSVSVILPESLNGSEDWTDEEINLVKSKIMAAMDWWAAREPNAHLNFVYNFEERVPTNYEPIEMRTLYKYLWVEEVMNELGYYTTTEDPSLVLYDYINDQRDIKETDWAFVIFVVDSSNDVDGRFADGRFAFASLRPSGGGPYVFMTYDNSGFSIERMDVVAAHEAGHIFGAKDQYGTCACNARAGYLYYENQNCVNMCLTNENSIMKSATTGYYLNAVDYYARGQIGWADSDGNGFLDIIDIEPVVSVNSGDLDEPHIYHPDKKVISNLSNGRNVLNNYFSYDGTASLGVFEAINPDYNTVSIDKVTSVQYRTSKTGPWAKVNKIKEVSSTLWKYKFKFQLFYPAKYIVEIKAIDRFGLETSEENYARLKVFV